MLGDTATIYYAEKPEGGIIRATKIIVVPGQRECPEIIGTWLEAVKGMPGVMQGIRIENGGIAESVNIDVYKRQLYGCVRKHKVGNLL